MYVCTHSQEARCAELGQELAGLKEEVSSLNIKVKWAQNKLKSETESHKVLCTSLSEYAHVNLL